MLICSKELKSVVELLIELILIKDFMFLKIGESVIYVKVGTLVFFLITRLATLALLLAESQTVNSQI